MGRWVGIVSKPSKKYVSDPNKSYIAKPRLNNYLDSKTFNTIKEAKKYLEEKTGYTSSVEDWFLIEKIIEVDRCQA